MKDATRLPFHRLREVIRAHDWTGCESPLAWFALLEQHGWTGEEYRMRVNELRTSRRVPPLPTCSICRKHHDTLEIAQSCARIPVRSFR